jgi:F-type H+-transporting ATPase subunit b
LKLSIPQTRLSDLAFRLLFLAFLIASFVAVPRGLAAQQAAPAAPEQAASSGSSGQPEAAKTQEEQDNVFRLEGPLVKASAKAFHISTETTARIYELINFAVVVLGIGIPLFKFLPGFLRKRGEKVRADMESARKVTEDANSRLSAVEAKLAKLDEEIAKFRSEVEEEMRNDEARIKSSFEEESVRIAIAAEQEIGVAVAQAKRGLKNFAADLAIDQAAKKLVLTPETDQALIAEFVGDVSKGGNN